jgi:hypothetical protein
MGNVLGGELPPPQEMIDDLAPGALNGHISAWSSHPDEQALFEQVGMDASLPVPTLAGVDSLAVTSNNTAGNKIDSFLERVIEYRPRVDRRTGDVRATLTVTLTNNAPSSGYPDYVIGAIADIPRGTNRTLIDVFTPLEVLATTVDGDPVPTVVAEYELEGNIGPGTYQLVYRPQPLPIPDHLLVEATTVAGDPLFGFDGVLRRRSVISAEGVEAWR